MRLKMVLVAALALAVPLTAMAADKRIKDARKAAPESISANATVYDWDLNVLAQGSNGWFCLPDDQSTKGDDPMCGDDKWLTFLKAYVSKEKPVFNGVGISYMLHGKTEGSNTDPYATEHKEGDDWVDGLGAHLMILVPDPKMLEGLPTDSRNGGPWVMWPNTPYAHLMVQVDSYPKK